jgi:hypothetical protein
MKKACAATCALILFAFAPVVTAQQRLASPPLPVTEGNTLACYVRNTGTRAVAVTVAVIVADTEPLVPEFDSCNAGPVGAGQTCVLLFPSQSSKFVACTARAESVSRLRGTLEVRETTPTLRVLVSEELR